MPTPADRQRRQMESDLRDASSRLEAVLGAAEIGTWTWDVVKDIVIPDDNLRRIFVMPESASGYPLGEFFKAIHPDDLPHVKAAIARSQASENGKFEDDYRVVQPGGQIRWVTARGTFFRDDSGRPVNMSGVLKSAGSPPAARFSVMIAAGR